MSQGLLTMSYIAASILFILSLSGLSQQETSRRGNYFGMAGMFIAILATVLGSSVHGSQAYIILVVALLIGGSIGSVAAAKVHMTQMPELVAAVNALELVPNAAFAAGLARFEPRFLRVLLVYGALQARDAEDACDGEADGGMGADNERRER